jgi:hypothetical protein
MTSVALAAALLFVSASTTLAVPIVSEVTSCSGGTLGTCTVEPTGGPVAVDPTGFTMEVLWGPDYIFFTEDPGGGTQSGLMRLFFDFTGTHDGTEHLGINIAFLDAEGNPIPGLTAGFDDLNAVGGVVTANYDIFGPSAAVHGFSLEASEGSGVTTMAWTRATIFPSALVEVPEPSLLYLLGAGVCVAIRRYRPGTPRPPAGR